MTNKIKTVGAFLIGLSVASSVTYAQLGGRGRNVQFVDGAAISPSSITSSGPVSGQTFNATTASGSQAYTCTNTGCRLSLGATTRYLVDDGTNLEFVAPVQATSFEATTTTGSALTGGGATNPLLFTSNTPDSWTNQGANGAFTFKAANNLNFGDSLVTFQDGTGATVARINDDGWFYSTAFASYNIGAQTSLYSQRSDSASSVAWSVDATNLQTEGSEIMVWRAFAPQNFWEERAGINHLGLLRVNKSNETQPTCNATNRGRIFYANHGGSGNDVAEVCMASGANYAWQPYAFGDANASFNSCNATATSGSSFSGGNASTQLLISSNTPDSITSTATAAIEMQASQNIDDFDALFNLKRSNGDVRFQIRENGRVVMYDELRVSNILPDSFATMNLNGRISDGASAVAIDLRSAQNLTTTGAKIVSVKNNNTTEVASIDKDGLLRVNAANAAKPTCNSTNRGKLFFLDGAAGVADTYEICMKNASDVYAWKTIVTP